MSRIFFEQNIREEENSHCMVDSGETHLINKGNLISIMTKIFALTTIIDNILFHHYDSEKINQTINEDLLVYALNRYFVNKI